MMWIDDVDVEDRINKSWLNVELSQLFPATIDVCSHLESVRYYWVHGFNTEALSLPTVSFLIGVCFIQRLEFTCGIFVKLMRLYAA